LIDTEKYEGHTEGPWESWSDYIIQKGNSWQEPIAEMDFNSKEADAQLIADAPLLLEEIERLHEIEREWKQLWSKLEDYPDICAELICFMESEEE
jgi:hypothetical protein